MSAGMIWCPLKSPNNIFFLKNQYHGVTAPQMTINHKNAKDLHIYTFH